jgi:hypothetical protein
MSQRSALIVAILVLSTGMGVFEAYLARHQTDLRVATAASLFPFAILLFAWCKADASHRRIAPPPAAALLVGLFAVIGIPYYFFRILPPLRAAIYSACALGILAFSILLAAAAYAVTLRVYAMV